MGCFLGCLRFKSQDRSKFPWSYKRADSKRRKSLVQRNKLALVFLCEDEGSPCDQEEHLGLPGSINEYSHNRELKNEANLLQSCGVLLETPAEFRKAPGKIVASTCSEDSLSLNLYSYTSWKKLDLDEPWDENADSPALLHKDSGYAANESGCCKSDEHEKSRKFVHFEEVKHAYRDESEPHSATSGISPSQTDIQTQPLDSSNSPYPTPINLTEEMQTPGTVYPVTSVSLRTGKKAMIRSQYVFPVVKPVENLSRWNTLREDSYKLVKSSDLPEQQKIISSVDARQNVEQTPLLKDSKFLDGREHSPQVLVPSLFQWLKSQPPVNEREDNKNVRKEQSPLVNCSDGDRPILGGVAAHWNYNEPSTVSLKGWDGNGIPNTTTKYKEDQKVSWHATPFEVRLEKALSDDKHIPQRKLQNGRPIEFDEEGQERDTAAS